MTARAASRARGPRRGRPPGKFTQQRRVDKLRRVLEESPAGVSIASIAALLGITPRSVRRYLEHLRASGSIEAVPVAPGRENLWRIKATERGRAIHLRRAPAYCLVAARDVFEPLRGSALFDALDLLHREALQVASRPAPRGAMQAEIRGDARLDERLLVLAPQAVSYRARAEEMDDLFRAVADLHVIRFRHRVVFPPVRGVPSGERVTAHPYALLLDRGAIHLVARDVERDELRAFAFDRMTEIALDERARFALPPEARAADFAHGVFGVAASPPSDRVRVLVEFDARASDEVRTRKLHPTQKIATAPDGRVRLSFAVPSSLLPEVARWVLSFADGARVIEPPELAREVRDALHRAAQRYI